MSSFEPLEFEFSELFDVLAEVRGSLVRLGSGLPDPQHQKIVQILIDEIKFNEQAIHSETIPVFKEMQAMHKENHRAIEQAEADFAALNDEREKLIGKINDTIRNLETNPQPVTIDNCANPVISPPSVLEFSNPPELVAWVLSATSTKGDVVSSGKQPDFPKTTGHIWQNWNLDSFSKRGGQ